VTDKRTFQNNAKLCNLSADWTLFCSLEILDLLYCKNTETREQINQHRNMEALLKPFISSQPLFDTDEMFHPLNTSDNIFILLLVILLTVGRYSFQDAVKRFLLSSKKFIGFELVPDVAKHDKFSESAWKATIFFILWSWSFFCVFSQPCFWDTLYCYKDMEKALEPSFRYYFLSQLSFYLHSLVAHVTIETRRNDYYAMLWHHICTCILVGFSYAGGYCRIGGVLLFLFDCNDVLFECGKMLLYAGFQRTSDALFVVLITCWATTRIYLYTFKVLRSTIFESGIYIQNFVGFYPLNGMLVFLLVLNIYWFSLMVKMLFKVILGKERLNDSREAKDD